MQCREYPIVALLQNSIAILLRAHPDASSRSDRESGGVAPWSETTMQ